MSVKIRIKDFCKSQDITISAFETSIGVSNGYVNAISKSIGLDKLNAIIEKYSNLNIEWLLTGKGEMLKTNCIETNSSETITSIGSYKDNIKAAFGQKIRNENRINPQSNPQGIPLVSVKAVGGFAGKDFLISENDIEAYYVIPKFRNLNVDFMIEVIGDSMMPRLFPGDIIACSIVRNSKIIQWNKTYLIATEDLGMIVKRLKKSSEQGSILAVSDNSDYDPFDIPLSDITGLARVVGVIHAE